MILALVKEATDAGARLEKACEVIELRARTLQRWRSQDVGEDRRRGPLTSPGNKLSPEERKEILQDQIVTTLRNAQPRVVAERYKRP